MAPAARVTAAEEGTQMQSCSSGQYVIFGMPVAERYTKGVGLCETERMHAMGRWPQRASTRQQQRRLGASR